MGRVQNTKGNNKLKKCENCGEVRSERNKRFCNLKCSSEFHRKYKTGKWSVEARIKANNTMKVKKTGLRDPKVVAKCIETNRNNGTSIGFNSDLRMKGTKMSQVVCKKNKTGIYDLEVKKRAVETNRNNGTSVYDPKVRALGIKKSVESNRKNGSGFFDTNVTDKGRKKIRERKRYLYNGLYFDSISEMKIGILLEKVGYNLVSGVNFQISVGNKFIDFFINGIFIEYHPILYFHKHTAKQYYKQRRKVLDENGFKNNPLIIIDERITSSFSLKPYLSSFSS